MKTRLGFVSNSSSSSFVVPMGVLTDKQIKALLDYDYDGWGTRKNICSHTIEGFTTMDNGELEVFLDEIDAPKQFFHFDKD